MSKPDTETPAFPAHSFVLFWWTAFKTGLRKSQEKFGKAADVAAITCTIGILVAAWYARHHKNFNADKEDVLLNYWQAIIPVCLWFVWSLYHVLKAPQEICMAIQADSDSKTKAAKEQIDALFDRLRTIEDSKPILSIYPAWCATDTTNKHFCRIEVANKSKTASAKMVKVDLLEIDPTPTRIQPQQIYSQLHSPPRENIFLPYPIKLHPRENDGDTINPSATSQFEVFCVSRKTSGTIKIYKIGGRTVADTADSGNFDFGSFDVETKNDVPVNSDFKDYRLKIRVSAEGIPPITTAFVVRFSREMNQNPFLISRETN